MNQSGRGLSQQSSLFQLGRERLVLIGRHAEILMQGYIQGHIEETALSEKAVNNLIDARILHRPDEQSPLTLKSVVNELIASLVQDERKRQINADVADHLDQIRTRVDSFVAARARGDYAASEHHMQLLTERVHDMSGQFGEAIESLWHRLNTEFGFVSSLDDKIREIELAQKQLRRLLDGFDIIDFNELIELAGSDAGLRKLLVSQLQARISEHRGSLLEVQKRLVHLMARFRQQQERALLVTRMAAFLRQRPNFQVGDYPNRSQVPLVVNQAAPISARAFVALDRSQDSYTLSELARAIPRPDLDAQDHAQVAPVSTAEQKLVATAQKQLAMDVENFFISVIDSAQPQSALEYLENKALGWDAEIWLFQVIAEFEGMNNADKQAFQLQKVSEKTSLFNDVRVIRDVHLGLAFFGEFQQYA